MGKLDREALCDKNAGPSLSSIAKYISQTIVCHYRFGFMKLKNTSIFFILAVLDVWLILI